MKLNGKMLATVAMMVGVLGAFGCSKPSSDASKSEAAKTEGASNPAPAAQGSDAVAPEETPESAATDETGKGFEQDSVRTHYYAPHAPPAARFEERGRAPSERHAWAPGYYRWSGRDYHWVGGRWYPQRDHYAYVSPHWENRFGRWEYIPGHWVRRF